MGCTETLKDFLYIYIFINGLDHERCFSCFQMSTVRIIAKINNGI